MKNVLLYDRGADYIATHIDECNLYLRYVGEQWVSRLQGKVAAHLEDNHDKLFIKLGKRKIKLDYGEAHQLYLLLRERNHCDGFPLFDVPPRYVQEEK